MEYRPIKTAPKDGTRILIKLFNHEEPRPAEWKLFKPSWFSKMVIGAWFDGDKPLEETFYGPFGGYKRLADPDHWMPIPKAPK